MIRIRQSTFFVLHFLRMKPAKDSKLFTDFPDISTNDWEEKIKADLKGADYRKKLIWKTDENIEVKPFYRSEDLASLDYLKNLGNLKEKNSRPNGWNICQDIWLKEGPEEANRRIKIALEGDAQAIRIHLDEDRPPDPSSVALLMKDLSPARTAWIFKASLAADRLFESLEGWRKDKDENPASLNGCLGADPLGRMTITGIPVASMENLGRLAKEVLKVSPGLKLIDLNGALIQDAGGNLVEELAFSLSMAVDYLDVLTQSGVEPEKALRLFHWSLASGPNYFMEIAKLRAARILWSKLCEAYRADPVRARVTLHSSSSMWNLTLYDPHTNILRGTTEAMSSVLGGADMVSVLPFDYLFGKTTEFSERIARNVQIILREESYFGRVADPAAGSYYVENLTGSLASGAWELFQETEQKGGYRKAFESGWIREKVMASREKKLERVLTGRQKIVGTNAYPNYQELVLKHLGDTEQKSAHETTVNAPAVTPPPGLHPFRPASLFEEIRLETERSAKRPRVLLFKYGNPGWSSARATFSGNFFACAGYEIIDQLPFKTVEEGIEIARKSAPDVVVLCSADDTYGELAPRVQEELEGKSLVVVAGQPDESMEALRQAGVQHFIHMRTNLMESLRKFNEILL